MAAGRHAMHPPAGEPPRGRVPALEGLRVLDLAGEPALFAGRILADLGADVILVEPPGGSPVRHAAPFLDDAPGLERSFRHLYLNANKRSVTLDITERDGAERLRHLIAASDVLIETAAPGDLARLGLAYEDLRAVNPGLIHVSVTPFGLDCEWAGRCTSDLVSSAAGGLLWVSGEPEDPPTHGAAEPAYKMASLVAAAGVMIALAGRDAGPQHRGCHLDISMQRAVAMAVLQTSNANLYTWHGRVPARPGMSGAFRCVDGKWAFMNPRPDRFEHFIAMLDEAGIEHDLGPGDWQLARAGTLGAENTVVALVERLAASLTRDEFLARAWAGDQLAMPILDFEEMATAEHFRVTGQFLRVEHDALGTELGFVRSPVDAMASEIPLRRAPTLGEHTDAVLAEIAAPARAAAAPPPRRDARELLAPLRGIRVVDLSWILAGPLGTRILANFGAEVIRVESRARIDSTRNGADPDGKPNPNLGALFNDVNTGKRSLTLDLTTEQGRELLRRLIATADVVTNNYRPGVLERLGFGYRELRRLKPDIVLLNMPGCGRDGPWAQRRTMGNLVMHASGYSSLMGFPGRSPRGLGAAYPDFTSPYLLAITVLAALRERARTGGGQELDLSQLSATISLLGAEWMRFARSGEQPRPQANRDPNYCPHGVYATRGEDEWCAIAVAGDRQWRALCALMGAGALGAGRRFATHQSRSTHEDEVDAVVGEWARGHDRWELASMLQARGIAAAAVESLRDTLEVDPQLRNHYQRIRQPSDPGVELVIDGEAIRFAGADHILDRAPMMGEDNEYVLREIVGLSQREFDRLIVEGAIN